LGERQDMDITIGKFPLPKNFSSKILKKSADAFSCIQAFDNQRNAGTDPDYHPDPYFLIGFVSISGFGPYFGSFMNFSKYS
jgi:hypothetical protein